MPLAATIGLDEAVLLHVLSELILRHSPVFRRQRRWGEITTATLLEALPFWEPGGIRRVQRSLQDLGLLLVDTVAGNNHAHLYAINQPDAGSAAATASIPAPPPRSTPFQSSAGTAICIAHDWQPDATLIQQCLQRNIPREFVEQAVPGFVRHGQERPVAMHRGCHPVQESHDTTRTRVRPDTRSAPQHCPGGAIQVYSRLAVNPVPVRAPCSGLAPQAWGWLPALRHV